jgi:hypothetical protein
MDGKQLKRAMLDALDEETASKLFNTDDRILYDYLDEAVVEFVRETKCLHATATITTVADQQAYDLPPDFLGLYMRNARDKFFGKYYDGSCYSYPMLCPYERIFRENLTDALSVPGKFAIIDKATAPTQISGMTTSAGARTAGQATLADSAALFTTTNLVCARDRVHNTTDGSSGIVLSVSSATALVTALFDGKTNGYGSGDSYVITRATAKQVYFDAKSESSGHTLTIPYLCKPSPVYSDYGTWRFDPVSCRAVCHEAAFQYANRKGEYSSADRHHALFSLEVTRAKTERAGLVIQGGRYRTLS